MNILITGGSSEIAQAIATRRIALGDKIFITCSTLESLQASLKNYQASNLSIQGFVYNFSHPEQSQSELSQYSFDAVILNAFSRLTKLRKLHEVPFADIKDYINTNLQGNIWLLQQLLPSMLAKQFGRLVFISSLSAITGTSHYSAYCAAKAALEALFFNLAVDYSSENILANIVRAGLFKTNRTKKFWAREGYQEKLSKIIPQGHMGEVFQIAEAIDPLLSPTAYITGSILTVSGGLPLFRAGGVL